MRVRIILGEATLYGRLNDTPAARGFAAMLPLDLTLTDFHGTEKVADLPSGLPTDQAPDGFDPEVGAITYFAPWGNLAIFYRDFGYARGLVSLGQLEGNIEVLEAGSPLEVRIERIDESTEPNQP